MSLRNKPYLPLYVQDFQTDEKLMECSAQATGVYIRVMCIMHKSEQYGKILLKQKDKQNTEPIKNFASKIQRHTPYSVEVIEKSLTELITEDVLQIDGDALCQKRMIRDSYISDERSKSGSKGGNKTQFAKAKHEANSEAKVKANSDIDIINESLKEKGGAGEKETSGLILSDPEKIYTEFENSDTWLNSRLASMECKKNKIDRSQLLDYIFEFIREQRDKEDLSRSFREYKRHFISWFSLKMIVIAKNPALAPPRRPKVYTDNLPENWGNND